MSGEPVAIAGAIQVLIGAIIGALVAFDVWNPTPEQTGAVFALYAAVIGIWTVVTRSKVTPNPSPEPSERPCRRPAQVLQPCAAR